MRRVALNVWRVCFVQGSLDFWMSVATGEFWNNFRRSCSGDGMRLCLTAKISCSRFEIGWGV
jgi:hypothetical protein